MQWLRHQWNDGDTYLWMCGLVILICLIGIILAFTVPVR